MGKTYLSQLNETTNERWYKKIDSTSAKHNNNQYSSHIPITINLISTQKNRSMICV